MSASTRSSQKSHALRATKIIGYLRTMSGGSNSGSRASASPMRVIAERM